MQRNILNCFRPARYASFRLQLGQGIFASGFWLALGILKSEYLYTFVKFACQKIAKILTVLLQSICTANLPTMSKEILLTCFFHFVFQYIIWEDQILTLFMSWGHLCLAKAIYSYTYVYILRQ